MAIRSTTRLLIVLLLLAEPHQSVYADGIEPATAQSWEIVQFGMPGDASFIFCSERQCPGRSIKTSADSGTATSRVAPVRVASPQWGMPAAAPAPSQPVTISTITAPAKKKLIGHRPAHRKHTPTANCEPVKR